MEGSRSSEQKRNDGQGHDEVSKVIMPKDTLTVSVKMPKGEILKVEVKLFYTIRAIKSVVGSLFNIPIDDLGFAYNGVHLDYSKNLACYNITEGSVLEMVPQVRFQVFVKDHFYGKTVTVDVHPGDLVRDLKKKLCAKLELPTKIQKLRFEGAYRECHRSISSYNISKDSTIQLHANQSRVLCAQVCYDRLVWQS